MLKIDRSGYVFVVRPVREGEAPAEPERRKAAPQERRPPIISETETGGTQTVVNPTFQGSRLDGSLASLRLLSCHVREGSARSSHLIPTRRIA